MKLIFSKIQLYFLILYCIITIIIIIITIIIIIMQVIYNYIPETKNISTAYNVGDVVYLQSVVHKLLFST